VRALLRFSFQNIGLPLGMTEPVVAKTQGRLEAAESGGTNELAVDDEGGCEGQGIKNQVYRTGPKPIRTDEPAVKLPAVASKQCLAHRSPRLVLQDGRVPVTYPKASPKNRRMRLRGDQVYVPDSHGGCFRPIKKIL